MSSIDEQRVGKFIVFRGTVDVAQIGARNQRTMTESIVRRISKSSHGQKRSMRAFEFHESLRAFVE